MLRTLMSSVVPNASSKPLVSLTEPLSRRSCAIIRDALDCSCSQSENAHNAASDTLDAAVLIPFCNVDGKPGVLLQVRGKLRTHSGEVRYVLLPSVRAHRRPTQTLRQLPRRQGGRGPFDKLSTLSSPPLNEIIASTIGWDVIDRCFDISSGSTRDGGRGRHPPQPSPCSGPLRASRKIIGRNEGVAVRRAYILRQQTRETPDMSDTAEDRASFIRLAISTTIHQLELYMMMHRSRPYRSLRSHSPHAKSRTHSTFRFLP